MRVRDLPLEEELLAHFEREGIEELYPPQAAAVEAGICEGERLVAAIPTASGKTFVAELAMLTAEGPALYIVPLRALAREKYETFSALPGVSAAISTGDYDATSEELAGNDVIVATSEKVDAAIRNGADWVADLACVVVDEVHLLGAEGRGPTLEVTLANLDRRIPGVQIVALSATVDNPDEIAAWLEADLIESTWRPIDLRTGVHSEGRVRFDDGTDLDLSGGGDVEGDVNADAGDDGEPATPPPTSADAETEATVDLVRDAVDGGGQCLAFVRSRTEAQRLAERLARGEFEGAPAVADDIAGLDDTDTGRALTDCVRAGVAFHHAGLTNGHRAAVETAFRNRRLRVICATPTLAAGVNVPARRVVVRDQQRYTGSGTEWLPVLEVHQMCGRAGRPHLDPYGEAVLVAGDADPDELWERYVEADPEAVESKLADPRALRTHVLSIVASGFADRRSGVLDILDATFYAHQAPESDLGPVVDEVIQDLESMGMIEVDGGAEPPDSSTAGGDPALSATAIGETVSTQYVTPDTGARIVAGIRAAADMEPTELTALEIVCDTPDMQDTYLGNRERADMYQFARRHAGEFTTAMGEAEDFEGWLESVKTARILGQWADGVDAADIVEQFRVGPGDLESRIERAEWLLGAADALASTLGADVPAFREVRERL
ncbi:MAG: DEAD/DEAH box helicase [Haloferacaceae archaeon]